ncbi:aspartyl-phosphate phosphatase Spo0E family protein [Peribacillus huizhouensis]|uniref:Spo0E family sporulation regulatory protein-aspartic acid phosphatase n=1 Tax=Peribacillus huizhouensis TaxID=1501239 RepID=A0ABR6CTH4_9BACI|nr:aspartyl-phosphate phosphatase Spo0E family protein [Peribacillus huizhouensis]MBA9028339.1 hypothetical protein [Peribacillus huizhouensis]
MKTTTLNDAPIEIELMRKELIKAGLELGLTAPKTLYLSQKLDKLMIVSICSKCIPFFPE